jgi:hypothetical protein
MLGHNPRCWPIPWPVFLHGTARVFAQSGQGARWGCSLLASESDLVHYYQLSFLYVYMSPFLLSLFHEFCIGRA